MASFAHINMYFTIGARSSAGVDKDSSSEVQGIMPIMPVNYLALYFTFGRFSWHDPGPPGGTGVG